MHYLLTLLLFLYAGQPPDPVKWKFSSKKISPGMYEIHLRASIGKGWHMYSQFNEGGPGPSSVRFDKNKSLKKIGDVKEIGKMRHSYEKLFDAQVREFSSSVDFVQTIQQKDSVNTIVTGIVKYIACNGTLCLPPKELPFSVTLNAER